MLELLDCRIVCGKLRGRASPLTAGADGMSDSECIGRPLHAMRAIAGGVGLNESRYSIDHLMDKRVLESVKQPPELELRD
jgi:hypothetical protein